MAEQPDPRALARALEPVLKAFRPDMPDSLVERPVVTNGQLRVLAAIAASQASAVQGWRPISEAPRDGRMILTYGGRRTEVSCEPADGEWWALGLSGDAAPTHWMPLPAPPAERASEVEGGA